MSNILTIINQDGVVLAYLNNLESASVHKVINGEYVLNFVAIIEELKTEFLYDDSNLIVYDNDYFRIVTLDDEHDSNNMLKVTVSCEHISYDLIVPKKLTFTHENRAAIYVMNDLLTDSGYTFTGTDVTTTASIDIQQETDIKSLLYQVAVIWGGEIEYFRKEIALKQQLGQNRGTDFRFGKNIENIRRHVDKVEGTVSYEVEVVQGSELEELGYYELGDTIRVVDDALNIEIDIRIIDIERDLITGLNGKVVLGEPIKDLSTKFNDIYKDVNEAKSKADAADINATSVNEKVNQVIDANGNLIASKLSGTLETAVQTIEGSKNGGISYVPNVGVMLHNQPTAEASTEAMLLTANGILISNSKNADGSWKWRTAATGQSISADAITTGQLTAITITGVTITGSSITSDDANSEIKLNNGILSVKKKSSNQQFNINYKTGLPEGITQTELEYYNEYKADNPNKLPTNTISLNSTDSYMDLAFGNAPVSLGNNWVKMTMYGGTFDWATAYPTTYADYLSGNYGYVAPPENGQGAKMIVDLVGNYWLPTSGFVRGSTTFVLNAHQITLNSAFTDVYGIFKVHGSKNCAIDTEKYGELLFSAYEMPDVLFGDCGENEVVNGECTIQLDEKLLECVNTNIPYQVFLQAYGDGRVHVAERNEDNFVVKGDNIMFGWEVKAKRKDYETLRFGQVN